MPKLYDLEALRPLSLFSPDVRLQQVTVEAEPAQIGALGQGRGRAAEVIYILRKQSGELLMVSKAVYPEHVFRLPTGGVEAGESPREAAIREIYEETGCRVTDPGLLGVVDYTLYWPEMGGAPFVSYVFLVDVQDDQAIVPAIGEIDDYRWVPVEALGRIAARLRSLPRNWQYWGRFRAVSYDFIQCGIIQYNHSTLEAR
jgi:8-oxo-dGTP pyrophosphatase MutT (NUDIX family)